jgi:hypothetical protein
VKPPFFLLRSGTLNVCDTVEEIEEQFGSETAGSDIPIMCDSEGQLLRISSGPDGLPLVVPDPRHPPSPDVIREVLRGYLERAGMSPDDVSSLPPADLLERACPKPDPRAQHPGHLLLVHLLIVHFLVPMALLLCLGAAAVIMWLLGL